MDLNYIITLLLLPVLILHRGHAYHHQRAGGDVQGRDEDERQRGDLAALGAAHVHVSKNWARLVRLAGRQ